MFSPYLTNFTSRAKHIITDSQITYQNGAVVNTSFLTNLGSVFIESDPELNRIIDEENRKNTEQEKRELNINIYPDELITSRAIGYLAKNGIPFRINENECYFIRALDNQKEAGKGVFGAGFLLSEAATEKYKKAKEAADENNTKNEVTWELSEREKEIVKNLGE